MKAIHLHAALLAGALLAGCAKPSPTPASPPSASAAASAAPAAPAAPALTAAELDQALRDEWQRLGVTKVAPADDATFLRRVWLDLGGTIPPADVVTAFLADRDPQKRAKAVEGLLTSKQHADHLTDTWDRLLLGRQIRRNVVDRDAFRAWLRERFARNEPWNKLVYDLLVAEGRNTDKPESEMGEPTPAAEKASGLAVNGAVNYVLRFENPADLTGTTSRVFLGVQIQCAQCHDHKTEKWKQTQFESLAACFMQTKAVPLEKQAAGKKGTRTFEVRDVAEASARAGGKMQKGMKYPEYAKAAPAALDGTDLSRAEDRRKALAAWMTSKDNPWFADAIVNRTWGALLGHGFVDPVDDIRPGNPPVAEAVMKRLSRDFVEHGYDLRRLIALITSTEAYQLSSAPPSGPTPSETRGFARFRPRPLGPEALVDAMVAATGIDGMLERGGADVQTIKTQVRNQFSFLFDVDEESSNDDEFDGTIPQVLLQINGRLSNQGASVQQGGALAALLALPGDDAAKVRALYLRVLSREPRADEVERWVAFVNAPRTWVSTAPPPAAADAKGKAKGKGGAPPDPLARLEKRDKGAKKPAKAGDPKRQAWEDMLWTLLNSSEFLFNH
ncbi:MAG: DUF1549 domain-containing protein [Polyangiaceae bacterium]|nr:DUF1549 domain-containing protein [Polyangiaceae bacterium]